MQQQRRNNTTDETMLHSHHLEIKVVIEVVLLPAEKESDGGSEGVEVAAAVNTTRE